jgi:subtilisin family serine protease
MAAPAVAGVIALILAEAKAKGLHLTIDEIRDILMKTARPTPPEHTDGWHPRYGYGRVDAAACVALVQPKSEPSVKRYESTPNRNIADADPEGIQDAIEVTDIGRIGNLRVSVDIIHTYIGDLNVQLKAPNGTSVILHDRQGGTTNNLQTTYTVDSLKDTTIQGNWILQVQDLAKADVGVLQRWELEIDVIP